MVPEWVGCLGGWGTWVDSGHGLRVCVPLLFPQGPWDFTAQSESSLDGSVSTV